MLEFIEQMYGWGCDIKGYLDAGVITQSEYNEIIGARNGTL